jgi:uncharacterized membrane protein YphA (DoxX/SURF4 family)
MNALIKPGRIFTALGLAGLAILSLISKDFIVGRPPAWAAAYDFNPALAYISASVLLICIIGFFAKNTGALSSIIIASLIFLLSITRHLQGFADWLNALKAIALFGGALVIAYSFLQDDSRLTSTTRVGVSARKTFLWIGCICLAAFFMAAGYAHFKFADFVVNFIPAYIPFRAFWTYFTGICLIAGGIGVVIPMTRKWASLLSGIMVFGWFLLLHIPRFASNINDQSDRLGLFESLTFAGMFFVLAGVSKRKD